jgi:hypothetical protein
MLLPDESSSFIAEDCLPSAGLMEHKLSIMLLSCSLIASIILILLFEAFLDVSIIIKTRKSTGPATRLII